MSIVSASGNIVFLWLVNEPLLHLNRPNTLFLEDLTCADEHKEAEYGVNEVFFLSRHVASSGTLSLTVHPIGIPWLLDSTTSGGIPGKCSPPNRRISSLFRSILGETKFRNLENKYQVTLEATHHGPHVDLPTCFVEIGSSENEWSDADAGDILADCLAKEFEFTHQQPPLEVDSNTNIVVISIGGGHYVPKMNDLAKLGPGIHIGHCLTTYALEANLKGEVAEQLVPGGWKQIISEAVHSTRISFPEGNFVCVVDKKAFVAKHCKMITEFLDNDLHIPWAHKVSDIKKQWESISMMKVLK